MEGGRGDGVENVYSARIGSVNVWNFTGFVDEFG
jgi:hypothetical protein